MLGHEQLAAASGSSGRPSVCESQDRVLFVSGSVRFDRSVRKISGISKAPESLSRQKHRPGCIAGCTAPWGELVTGPRMYNFGDVYNPKPNGEDVCAVCLFSPFFLLLVVVPLGRCKLSRTSYHMFHLALCFRFDQHLLKTLHITRAIYFLNPILHVCRVERFPFKSSYCGVFVSARIVLYAE